MKINSPVATSILFCLALFSDAAVALTCQDIDGAYVIGADGTYLGFFGNRYAGESINNPYGIHGGTFSSVSVRNPYGSYGSQFALLSANNPYTTSPPAIYSFGTLIGYLSANRFLAGAVSLSDIDANCFFISATSPKLPTPTSSTSLPVPAPLTGLAASQGTIINQVNLLWNHVAGASGYAIYVSLSAPKSQEEIILAGLEQRLNAILGVGTLDSSSLTPTELTFLGITSSNNVYITGAIPGTTYYYTVYPVNEAGVGTGQWTTGFAAEAPNEAPIVAISGGDQTVDDSNEMEGESVNLSASVTDDGSISSAKWLVNGVEVASGYNVTLELPDGASVVTFTAIDDAGASATDEVTIQVSAPPYAATSEWPSPYNGVTPDAELGLEINNISVFLNSDATVYACLKVTSDGLASGYPGFPVSGDGSSEYDVGLTVVSLADLTVKISKLREFNQSGALNELGFTPDCSGVFETTSGIYTDIIKVDNEVLETKWELVGPDQLIFQLKELRGL